MSSPSRRRQRYNRHSSSSPDEYPAGISKRMKQSTDQYDKGHRRASGERVSDQQRRYTSICVKNINPKISDNEVRRLSEKKFSKYGPNTIKIYYKNHERVAFVNFTNCSDAKHARHAKSDLIWDNWQLILEPVYYRRHHPPDHPLYDERNKYSPSRPAPERSQAALTMRHSPVFSKPRYSPYNHRSQPYTRTAPPRRYSPYIPLPPELDGFAKKSSRRHRRRSSSSSHQSTNSNNNRNNNNNDNNETKINNEDRDATRTIFVGNLERDITEEQLQDVFDKYGVIEEIDLKIPSSSSKRPYAFIQYENLDMAFKAKSQQDGRLIGKSEARIGYGKVVPTTCLWVGNLHPQLKKRDLEREFAHYGQIKSIEFNTGDKQAYIVYNDVEDAIKARGKLLGSTKLTPTAKRERGSRSGSSTSLTRSPSRYRLRIDYHESSSSHRSVVSSKKPSHRHQSATDNASKQKRSPSSASAASHVSSSKGSKGPIERVRSITPRQRSTASRSPISSSNEEQQDIKQEIKDESTSPLKRHHSSSPSPTKRQRNKRERSSSPGRTFYGPFGTYISPRATNSLTKMNDLIVLCEQLNNELVKSTKSLSTVYPVQFLLKSCHYDARMHFIAGNPQFCVNVLGQPGDLVAAKTELKVTQRLRLDPAKLDDLESKLRSNLCGSSKSNTSVNETTLARKPSPSTTNFAILISSPRKTRTNYGNGETEPSLSSPIREDNEEKPLSSDLDEEKSLSLLISYLATKEAAGVIPIQYHPSTSTLQQQSKDQTAVLHAFPPCSFTKKLLKELCPSISFGGNNAGPSTPPSEDDEYINILATIMSVNVSLQPDTFGSKSATMTSTVLDDMNMFNDIISQFKVYVDEKEWNELPEQLNRLLSILRYIIETYRLIDSAAVLEYAAQLIDLFKDVNQTEYNDSQPFYTVIDQLALCFTAKMSECFATMENNHDMMSIQNSNTNQHHPNDETLMINILINYPNGVDIAQQHSHLLSKYLGNLIQYVDKRSNYELEYTKQIVNLIKDFKQINIEHKDYLPGINLLTNTFEHELINYNTMQSTWLILQTDKFVEKLTNWRNYHDSIRKTVNLQWEKILKQFQDSLNVMKKARAVYFDRQDEYDRCKETNNNQLFHSSSSSSSSSEHSKQIAANHLSIVSPSPLHLHRTVSSPPTLPANDDLKRREKDILEKDLRTKLYDSEMYLKSCLTDLNTKRSEVLNTKYDSITTLNKLIINTENVINHVLYDYFDMLYALYTQLPKPYESDILKFIDQNKQSYLVYLKNLPLSSSEHDYLHYENYISLPQSLIVGDEQIKSTQSYQECDEFVRQQKSKTIENNCTTAYLPSIVQQCCSAIEKMSGQYIKGIYRISSVKSKVDQLCRELRNGKLISENELINDYSPNVLANVIKKCLRELSSPLLLLGKDKSIDCYSLYKDFMSVAKELYTFNDSTNSNITSLVEKLEKIIHERLSDDARLTLHCLLKHLKYISSYEDENQMSTSNLGIIFGPTLFKTENLTEDDTISTLLDAPYQAKLVEFLIDNVEELYQNVDEQHKQVDSSNSQ